MQYNLTWNINFHTKKSDIILSLSTIGQYLVHSFNSRIGPSIIWKLVKTEPCMTSSFHETKSWERTCKHHYNDILTNMQTISHKSSEREERRRKHNAQCRAHCWVFIRDQRPRTITMRTPGSSGCECCHHSTPDWHSVSTSVFLPWPAVDWVISNGRAQSSPAEPGGSDHRLLPPSSLPPSPLVWSVSTCRLCSELAGPQQYGANQQSPPAGL